MKYTDKYREKYAIKMTKNFYKWRPAGSKDVLRLCGAVDALCLLLDDCTLWLDGTKSEEVRNRMNMILMRLGEAK